MDLIQEQFEKEALLMVNRGLVHTYLGMKIDYSVVGKVQITMGNFIDEIIEETNKVNISG